MTNPARAECTGLARGGLFALLAFALPAGACLDFDHLDRCAREPCAASSASRDGGSEASGSDAGDAGEGEIFATGQSAVVGLARGAGTLFWATAAPDARVASCPVASCGAPTVVASGGSPSGIAWAGRTLWTDDRDVKSVRFTTDASGNGALDMGQPSLAITADADAYVVQKNGTIVKLVGSPPAQRTTFLPFATEAVTASTRGAAVAWLEADGSVHACASGGCATAAASVVAKGEGASSVALDDAFLFWATADGRIRAAPRTATAFGTAHDVASGLPGPAALAADANGAALYVTARGTAAAGYADGIVGKVAKSGGAVIVVARGQARPGAIAVDGTHVYWANGGDATIRRAPK